MKQYIKLENNRVTVTPEIYIDFLESYVGVKKSICDNIRKANNPEFATDKKKFNSAISKYWRLMETGWALQFIRQNIKNSQNETIKEFYVMPDWAMVDDQAIYRTAINL